MKKGKSNESNNLSQACSQEFDLIKSISERLSVLEQSMYKLTKEYKHVLKQIKNPIINEEAIQIIKEDILKELRLDIQNKLATHSTKIYKDKAKSEVTQDTRQLIQTLGIKRIKQDIMMLKQDATQTYKIASKALKSTISSSQQSGNGNIEKYCSRLVQNSMNQVMLIMQKYIEDQAIIKMEIESIKAQIFSVSITKLSPKAIKNKRTNSISKTSDKKHSNQKWDGTASQRKSQMLQQRQRIMTITDGNKSGKSFQKISDLKQKLKQFQMINDKYKTSKKQKTAQKSERKSSINKSVKKQDTQAINELKKFKDILQNTQSQIDVSNTLNQQQRKSALTNYSKFNHLSKLYSDNNK